MNQMNHKALILSIPVITAILLLGGWLLFREPKSAPESQSLPVAEENSPQNAGNLQPPANVESSIDTSKQEKLVDTQSFPKIDMSDWKTYRSEKYGFEFDLPNEYTIPENEKNVVGKKKNANILDPKQTEYLFNSRQGLELSRKVQTTGDNQRIRLKVYPYSKTVESNFEVWVKSNSTVSLIETGKKVLKNGNTVAVASWNSICDDYSAFFIKEDYILELNTCGSTFLSDMPDSKEDYFSLILNSVRF